MKRIVSLLALAALVAGATVAAAAGELRLQAGSRLWLTGTSTVHDYSSQASRLEVSFATNPARWPATPAGGEAVEALIRAGGVTGIDVVVPVAGLKSGKDKLDQNMYKALRAEEHPEIRFRMAGYQVGAADTAGAPIEAKGTLTIAGVEREIVIAAVAGREGEVVRLRCEVPLLMTDFGIKPPKMMLGALRTSNKVSVHIDLRIGTAGDTAVAPRIE